jgi:hypothetical protein
MTRRALAILTFALAAGLGTSSVFSQTPPNTTQLQPASDIPRVIKFLLFFRYVPHLGTRWKLP